MKYAIRLTAYAIAAALIAAGIGGISAYLGCGLPFACVVGAAVGWCLAPLVIYRAERDSA